MKSLNLKWPKSIALVAVMALTLSIAQFGGNISEHLGATIIPLTVNNTGICPPTTQSSNLNSLVISAGDVFTLTVNSPGTESASYTAVDGDTATTVAANLRLAFIAAHPSSTTTILNSVPGILTIVYTFTATGCTTTVQQNTGGSAAIAGAGIADGGFTIQNYEDQFGRIGLDDSIHSASLEIQDGYSLNRHGFLLNSDGFAIANPVQNVITDFIQKLTQVLEDHARDRKQDGSVTENPFVGVTILDELNAEQKDSVKEEIQRIIINEEHFRDAIANDCPCPEGPNSVSLAGQNPLKPNQIPGQIKNALGIPNGNTVAVGNVVSNFMTPAQYQLFIAMGPDAQKEVLRQMIQAAEDEWQNAKQRFRDLQNQGYGEDILGSLREAISVAYQQWQALSNHLTLAINMITAAQQAASQAPQVYLINGTYYVLQNGQLVAYNQSGTQDGTFVSVPGQSGTYALPCNLMCPAISEYQFIDPANGNRSSGDLSPYGQNIRVDGDRDLLIPLDAGLNQGASYRVEIGTEHRTAPVEVRLSVDPGIHLRNTDGIALDVQGNADLSLYVDRPALLEVRVDPGTHGMLRIQSENGLPFEVGIAPTVELPEEHNVASEDVNFNAEVSVNVSGKNYNAQLSGSGVVYSVSSNEPGAGSTDLFNISANEPGAGSTDLFNISANEPGAGSTDLFNISPLNDSHKTAPVSGGEIIIKLDALPQPGGNIQLDNLIRGIAVNNGHVKVGRGKIQIQQQQWIIQQQQPPIIWNWQPPIIQQQQQQPPQIIKVIIKKGDFTITSGNTSYTVPIDEGSELEIDLTGSEDPAEALARLQELCKMNPDNCSELVKKVQTELVAKYGKSYRGFGGINQDQAIALILGEQAKALVENSITPGVASETSGGGGGAGRIVRDVIAELIRFNPDNGILTEDELFRAIVNIYGFTPEEGWSNKDIVVSRGYFTEPQGPDTKLTVDAFVNALARIVYDREVSVAPNQTPEQFIEDMLTRIGRNGVGRSDQINHQIVIASIEYLMYQNPPLLPTKGLDIL